MCTRQHPFRGDATSLLSVEWSSRDTTGSVCSRALGRHAAGGAHGACAPGCVRARALRGGPPRARGVPPRGRRALVDGDAASPSSEPAPPPRARRCRRGSLRACLARGARLRRARVPLRVRRAPRDVRRWDYRGFAQQGSGRRAHGGGRALLGAAAHAAHRARRGSGATRYTRCGRTDAGVSALGQIVSLRLRSKRGTKGRKRREETNEGPDPRTRRDVDATCRRRREKKRRRPSRFERRPPRGAFRFDTSSPRGGGRRVFFAEHAEDELDYCALLNRALPEDVRVTGWGYVHESFSARFDCEFRLYKYFFCAFPDPAERVEGPLGDEGDEALSGLDLDAMRDAARRFEGTHDFRNLCKMDARNVHNYVRTVYRCDVVDAADAGSWEDGGGARGRGALRFSRLKAHTSSAHTSTSRRSSGTSAGVPPGLCYVRVEGSAFLWHQVRCMGRGAVPGRAAPGNPRHRRRAAGQNKVQKRKAAVRDGAGCAAGAVAVRVRARRAAWTWSAAARARRCRRTRAAHGRGDVGRGAVAAEAVDSLRAEAVGGETYLLTVPLAARGLRRRPLLREAWSPGRGRRGARAERTGRAAPRGGGEGGGEGGARGIVRAPGDGVGGTRSAARALRERRKRSG